MPRQHAGCSLLLSPFSLVADAMPEPDRLDPSPANVRFVMASVESRSGELAAARALLEKGLSQSPNATAYALLASVLRQAGDSSGALTAIAKADAAPDAANSPAERADAHLLGFEIQRAAGAVEPAKGELGAALRATLDARRAAQGAAARARAERLLARVAYHYGDKEARGPSHHARFRGRRR